MSNEAENQISENAPNPALNVALVSVGTSGIAMAEKMNLGKFPLKKIFLDTSSEALEELQNSAGTRILLGEKECGGLGCGMDETLAERAAEVSSDEIRNALKDVDLAFLVSAFGRGTGSGAAPVVAKILRNLGITTLCFATMPFSREGVAISSRAVSAAKKINAECHAFVAIEDDLVAQIGEEIKYTDGYKIARSWIERGINACCSIIFNSDAEAKIDLQTFKKFFPTTRMPTLFSLGEGKGETAVEDALEALSKNPILKTTFAASKADTLIFHLQTGRSPSLQLMNDISDRIQKRFGGNECWIPSFSVVPELGDSLKICLIGSGESENSRSKKSKISDEKILGNDAELFENAELGIHEQTDLSFDENTIGNFRPYNGVNLDQPTFIRRGIYPEALLKKLKKRS